MNVIGQRLSLIHISEPTRQAVEFLRPVSAVVVSVALIHGRHTPARVVTLELIRATRYTHMRLSYAR